MEFKRGDKVKILINHLDDNYRANLIHPKSKIFGHYTGNYDNVITILEIGSHYSSAEDIIYGVDDVGRECCFDVLALKLVKSNKVQYEIY